jgi:hypothetical protein
MSLRKFFKIVRDKFCKNFIFKIKFTPILASGLQYTSNIHELVKGQVWKMSSLENGKLGKWQVGKMASWENGKAGKWQVGKMAR